MNFDDLMRAAVDAAKKDDHEEKLVCTGKSSEAASSCKREIAIFVLDRLMDKGREDCMDILSGSMGVFHDVYDLVMRAPNDKIMHECLGRLSDGVRGGAEE